MPFSLLCTLIGYMSCVINRPMDFSHLSQVKTVTFKSPNPDYKQRGVCIYVTKDFYIVETLSNFYVYDAHFMLWKEIIKGFSSYVNIGIYKDKYFYYCDERDSKIVYVNMPTKQRKATQHQIGIFFPCGRTE